jgi:NtrC-family two-component system sensor histidine kinase KinB
MNTIPQEKIDETRASLELLYHVSREIVTTLDLATLLERILVLSIQNIGATNGSIIALDDDGNSVASTLIINSEVFNYSSEELQDTLDRGLAGWVVSNRQAVLISDTSKDKRWLQRPDDAESATGPKSAISAPFLVQERLAGVITLVHPKPNFFTPDHRALIQAIADLSAVAVLNARLHTDTLRQARLMTALAESATVITGSLNLSEVLQRILEQISHALDTEAVSLAMVRENEDLLEYYASTLKSQKNVIGMTLKIGQGIAGWVAKEKTGVIVPNVSDDDRFLLAFDENTGFVTRAIACTPIIFQDKVIGVIEAINPKTGKFDSDALKELTEISSLAGTAIRHAQLFEALQAAHKRYHVLFEGNINSIIITDWGGKIIEANQQTETLSNYSQDELQASSIEMIHEINLEILGMNFEHIPEDQAISYESILYTKNETEIPITVLVQSVNIEGKSFLQWVFRDDTKRKELDKLREDLLSMIYHDLRSPLANVVSSLDVLSTMVEFSDADPAIQSLFDIVVRSTKRIQRLTHSLLDINLLEAGQPVLNKKLSSPPSLLADALDALRPILENKKIQVSIDVPDDIPKVLINEDMIGRVVINLVENAIKFTPSGGAITIGAQQSNHEVRFWVQDNGPGIPKEDRKVIFDKYTRLHGRGGPKGYGLGLAYCRLAVEGHGGNIWVDDAPEGGSHFTFTIPIPTEIEIHQAEVDSDDLSSSW